MAEHKEKIKNSAIPPYVSQIPVNAPDQDQGEEEKDE